MSEPFDLDAIGAEATAEPFRFTFGGEEYELPPSIDMLAVPAMVAGDLLGGFRRLFTDEQWRRLQASPATLDLPKMLALLKRYADHSGVSLGEFGASTRS